MPKFIDITGHRYNRLTVIQQVERDKRGYIIWLCRCDCGNETKASSNSLRVNNTRSCGCLAIEVRGKTGKANRIHGESKCGSFNGQPSREYRAWNGLKERCYNPNNKNFAEWGGRGITVCERWMTNYTNFLADMGRCPPGKSIGRIDNDGPYSPDNCRWETASQQNKNRRPLKRDKKGRFSF